jgi:hypothetical protein
MLSTNVPINSNIAVLPMTIIMNLPAEIVADIALGRCELGASEGRAIWER